MAGTSRPGFALSAVVGKRPKASGARIAQSWPNFQVRTAANFVGLTPRSGHSAAPMHRQAQKDAGPLEWTGVSLSWRRGAIRRRHGCRIGSGLPSGESPPTESLSGHNKDAGPRGGVDRRRSYSCRKEYRVVVGNSKVSAADGINGRDRSGAGFVTERQLHSGSIGADLAFALIVP